jgi:hypothetical protein
VPVDGSFEAEDASSARRAARGSGPMIQHGGTKPMIRSRPRRMESPAGGKRPECAAARTRASAGRR